MTWILYFYRECYYDLRTYFRNLFKSSTEEWLEAELMVVDEALGFNHHSSRFPGDRIARIGNMNEANSKLLSMWEKVQNKAESLSQDNLSLRSDMKVQLEERDKLQEELKTWKDAYAHEHQLAEDLYKQASECQIERDKLKLELRDERKWSQDLARMADERGDKIGKLNDEIETLKNRRSELVNDKMRLVREVETYKDAYNTLKRQLEGAQE